MAPRTRGKDDASKVPKENASLFADEGNTWAQLAQKHWLKKSGRSAKAKVKPDVVKNEIWDALEKDDFSYSALLSLENLQLLDG